MSKRGGTEVRRVINRGYISPPKKRFFGWVPPTDWWSGDVIPWRDLSITATGGTRDVSCIPQDRKLVAGDIEGSPVTLKLVMIKIQTLMQKR